MTKNHILGEGATAPQWVRTSLFMRFIDHTQRRTAFGRTPLDEWSARRRDLYLTTRQTSMPTVGFEPIISAGEWQQNYALERATTGPAKVIHNTWNCYVFRRLDAIFRESRMLRHANTNTTLLVLQKQNAENVIITYITKLLTWAFTWDEGGGQTPRFHLIESLLYTAMILRYRNTLQLQEINNC